MQPLDYSIIIPVYNRPHELEELLESIATQEGELSFEVVIVDDGSEITCEKVVNQYKNKLNIKYCFKNNSGPGDSRNYGMQRASGRYFMLFDSDCLLPENYLMTVDKILGLDYVDAYGGPDLAHHSFTNIQKAINYSMTSMLTTGGLRNSEETPGKFQLRSFNMGISRQVFELTGGFSTQRIGEDIDLSFRIVKSGCSTRFIPEAFVYHKRRTGWVSFYRQTRNFGAARPILNRLHPKTAKISYWFPSLFLMGLLIATILGYFHFPYLLWCYGLYLILIAIDSTKKNKNILVGILSAVAALVQFAGYGWGFLRSTFRLFVLGKSEREAFSAMFS